MFNFALPPALKDTHARAAAARQVLTPVGCTAVQTSLTYGALLQDLLQGNVHAAWAPPLVCAAVERAGGRVLYRGVRNGGATYRSALYARKDRRLKLDALPPLTAAWLDQRSMGGHLLARDMLISAGYNPETLFTRQRFLGSYQACVTAVLDGAADVSACFAPAHVIDRAGYSEMAGARSRELTVLGYSEECPNDGIALAPPLTPEMASDVVEALRKVLVESGVARQWCNTLEVEWLETPPPGSYLTLGRQLEAYL